MYKLLSRIPEGLEPLRKKFEDHVKKAGLAAVEKITPAAGAVSETGKAETLVSVRQSRRQLLRLGRTRKRILKRSCPCTVNTKLSFRSHSAERLVSSPVSTRFVTAQNAQALADS